MENMSGEDFRQRQERQIDKLDVEKTDAERARDRALDEMDRVTFELANAQKELVKKENELEKVRGRFDRLEEKHSKLVDDHDEYRETIAASARHITYLRERLQRDETVHAAPPGVRQIVPNSSTPTAAPAPPPRDTAAEEEKRKMQQELQQLREETQKLKEENQKLRTDKTYNTSEIARMNRQLIEARAPATVYFTRGGSCYHNDGCNHLKHGREDRPRSELRKCKDCFV